MKNIYYAITARYKKIGNDSFAERFTITKSFIDMANDFNIVLIPICSIKGLDEIADMCSGVIITGSSQNIKPSYYSGIDNKDDAQAYDEYKFSREVINAFLNKNKRVLGICYGMQAINVFFGGTLKSVDNHEDCKHNITILKDNYFDDFINKYPNNTSLYINSDHSQALDIVADKLQVIATSKDGTVEAVQGFDKIIAVQWHPELDFRENILSYYIFKKFIENDLSLKD